MGVLHTGENMSNSNPKFSMYEIVEVDLNVLKSYCTIAIEQGCMHSISLEYLLAYPIGTIKNREQDNQGKWSYLVDFLDSSVDDTIFKEENLSSTGKFSKPCKFNCFEIVKIVNPATRHKKLQYLKGVVTAMSQDRNGMWGYSVNLLQKQYASCDCEEYELESTEEFAKKEDFYSGESIKVIVYPDGRGELKEEN